MASQVALVVKNLPANAGDIRDAGLIPGWEDPLEKGVTTHSSILAWRIHPHGQRSLVAYSPWGLMIEGLRTTSTEGIACY